ncbi:hypothetical protein GCM10007111_03970 [Virgibacillus kapii]|uniref:Uncharacterized protein n=1 Tax=Virgibacillus kapii TaxID=1638645 RepID=A0ABQ2D623_9BACI|nr:hypothetical protein GCM10007111_03970 [Virgibacillus kapii]
MNLSININGTVIKEAVSKEDNIIVIQAKKIEYPNKKDKKIPIL